jgi:hypothetical protein
MVLESKRLGPFWVLQKVANFLSTGSNLQLHIIREKISHRKSYISSVQQQTAISNMDPQIELE